MAPVFVHKYWLSWLTLRPSSPIRSFDELKVLFSPNMEDDLEMALDMRSDFLISLLRGRGESGSSPLRSSVLLFALLVALLELSLISIILWPYA